MVTNWQKENPPTDGSYLVHLQQEAALRLGLGGLPFIAIARYKIINHEWSVNGSIIPQSLTRTDIIEWHEIPPFSNDQNR